MHLLDVVALLVSLTALFAYANHRLLRLPTTIGVMLIALLLWVAAVLTFMTGWDYFRKAMPLLKDEK